MSGFREDVISILKQNNMYHKEAIGLIKGHLDDGLFETLQEEKFPVSKKFEKFVLYFDYIVLNNFQEDVETLLFALASVSTGGLIVLEITDSEYTYQDRYVSQFGLFSVTKVKYEDRTYLVFRNGLEYGN